MDWNGIGTVITALFAGLGGLMVVLNGRRSKAVELDEEDKDELERFRDWRPDVVRWHAEERARMAGERAPDLRPLPPFPKSLLKQKKTKPVKTDDDS